MRDVLQLCSVVFAGDAQTSTKLVPAVICRTGENGPMSRRHLAIGAGTRLHLDPLDASYMICINAALLSSALLSSFMIAI